MLFLFPISLCLTSFPRFLAWILFPRCGGLGRFEPENRTFTNFKYWQPDLGPTPSGTRMYLYGVRWVMGVLLGGCAGGSSLELTAVPECFLDVPLRGQRAEGVTATPLIVSHLGRKSSEISLEAALGGHSKTHSVSRIFPKNFQPWAVRTIGWGKNSKFINRRF